MIFQRMILFLDRLKLIHGLFSTALEIFKIEKVIVAGLKGRDLTNKIDQILQVFKLITNLVGVLILIFCGCV